MKMARFLSGLVWGGLVGAGLVLLFTPYSGEEMQQKIREWVEQVQTAGQEAAEQKRLELTTQFEEAKRVQS